MLKKIKVVVLSVMMIFSLVLGVVNANNSKVMADAPVLSESITTEDMIKGVLAAGVGEDGGYSKSVDMSLFSYSIGYGKVDAETNTVDFHGYEVNSSGLRTSAVYNSSKYQTSVLLSGGTARIGNHYLVDGVSTRGNFNIVYRLVVKQDAQVTVTHDGRNNNDKGIVVNLYQRNANGTTTLLTHELPSGGAAVAKNAYGGTFSVSANDEFIFEFAYVNDANNVATFYGALYPDFRIERTDALAVQQAIAIETLTNAKNAVVADGYAAEDYQAIVALYDAAIVEIGEVNDLAQIAPITERVNKEVADILTTADAVSYRADAVARMNEYAQTIDAALYKAETYASIIAMTGAIEEAVATLTKKSAIDAAYDAIIAEVSKVEKDAPVTELTTTFAEIVNGVIGAGTQEGKGYNGYGENQLVQYALGYGRASKALSQLVFNGFEVSNQGLATEKTIAANNPSSFVSTNGSIQVSNSTLYGGSQTAFSANVIFKLVAKENIRVTITHPAGEGAAKAFVKTYKTEENEIWQLKVVDIGEAFEANAYGGVWTVKAGDALYLEYAIEDSGFVTAAISAIPSFFVEVIDESELVSAIPSDSELEALNSHLLDMISVTSEYGGGAVKAKGIDWQLLHGTVEAPATYEIVGGDILRTEKKNANGYNSIYAANSTNKFVRTDPNNNEEFLVKISARQNVKVSISSDAWQKGTHGLSATYEVVLTHYSEEESRWYFYTFDSRSFSYPTELEAGLLNVEIHLNAGDTMYYVIKGVNHQTNITFLPSFNVDPAAYEADKVFDFMSYMQTQEAMASVKASLQTAYDALALDDYAVDAYLEICAIYDEALINIDNCTTLVELEEFVATTNQKVANYIKVSEAEAESQRILATMQGYIDALDESKYLAETWASILAIKAELEADLEDSYTRSEHEELLIEAKAELDLIQEDNTRAMKSCKTAMGSTTVLVLLSALACMIIRKKSK